MVHHNDVQLWCRAGDVRILEAGAASGLERGRGTASLLSDTFLVGNLLIDKIC